MRTSTIFTGAFASLASAQIYQTQTPPFTLAVSTTDQALNGSSFTACHEGAGIEGLCVARPGEGSQFTFNYTTPSPSTPSSGQLSGLLTYELHGGNFNESEAMSFFYDPATNVALPLFEPENYQTVTFMGDQLVVVTTNATNGSVVYLNHWYTCTTYYEGYTYDTLAFVVGRGGPDNASCRKVDVVKVPL